MAYEMIGKLHKKFDTESKSASFQAREFVVESLDGSYTQYIKFQLTQDRCSIIDGIKEGDNLKVHFDLRGREWNEKYFTNLNAWKVEAQTSQDSPSNQFVQEPPFPTEEKAAGGTQANKAEDFDDLPF